MVHVNKKLVDYFKMQSQSLEFSAEKTQSSIQEAIKGQNATGSELAQEIITLKAELEQERQRKKEMIKLVEHERGQFERTMKENKYSSRKTSSDLHEQIKQLKQTNIEKDLQLKKIKTEKIALQEDIALAVEKEKKLKQEI